MKVLLGTRWGMLSSFSYGEDGIDAVCIETQKLDSLKMKKVEFDKSIQI